MMFRSHRLILGILFLSVPALGSTLPSQFTLGSYVPGDCWLYIHSVDSPENAYFDECWGRVFSSLMDSGIGGDLRDLILSDIHDPKDRQDFLSFWTKAGSLLSGVQWGDLVDTEFVFAERFSKGVPMPEFLMLCRIPDADARKHNIEGLQAILTAFADLNEDITYVDEKTASGVVVSSVYTVNAPITFHVFQEGEIVGITLGCGILRDSISLLKNESKKGSILESKRFLKGIQEVPSPEIQMSWVDISMMMESICSLPNLIAPQHGNTGTLCPSGGETKQEKKEKAEAFARPQKADSVASKQQVVLANDVQAQEEVACVQGLIAQLLKETDVVDYIVTTSSISGLQQKCTTVCRMKADSHTKLFGRIASNTRTMERVEKFIPVDATGFSISASFDPAGFYSAMLEFLEKGGSLTQEVLNWWNTTCRSIGLDPNEDVFSWLSGETISVTLKPAMPSPFGGEDSVLFVRVKDSAKAVEKVKTFFAWINKLLTDHQIDPIVLVPVTIGGSDQFYSLKHTHPMAAFVTVNWGVYEDWLVVGTSAPSIKKCIDAGKPGAKTILQNPRFAKEGIAVKGPVASASFTDLRLWTQQVGTALTMLNFSAQMLPSDSVESQKLKSLLMLASRFGPVIAQVNFLSSSASVTTVEGNVWTTENVMNYIKLEPPTPAPAQQDSAEKPAKAAPQQ